MICPQCKKEMHENLYWRARRQGYDFFCFNCHIHYRSKDKKIRGDEWE